MTLSIRGAAPGDEALVLKFVRDLASYEKLLHEVEATEADLARDLFGPSPRVFCELAFWNGQPAGFAWRVAREVDMLYVAPAAARRGIGRALLARLTDDMAGQLGPWHAAVSDMALPLFEQAGWQCCEREVVVRDGVEIPRSWMKHVSGAAGDQSVTGE